MAPLANTHQGAEPVLQLELIHRYKPIDYPEG